MQLDKLIIVLRQRNPWEAMDLGVLLMQRLWPVIFLPWLIVISSSLFVLAFITLQGYGWVAIFFMWWLKPLYESVLLHIFSRHLFGEALKPYDVFSSASQWLKSGLLNMLLFWRLSPSRSFNMPVYQLEGLRGATRKKRLSSLHRMSGSHSVGATIIGLHFEVVIFIALYVILILVLPESMQLTIDESLDVINNPQILFLWGLVLYSITLFILEPYYVVSGFMLYLNRRTQLEGWDIELDFKSIQRRLSNNDASMKEASQYE